MPAILPRLRTTLLALCAAVVGLVLAEGLIRVLVPEEVMFETWFTPGIHTYDAEMGFIFTPDYAGRMHHADGLWVGENIRLDAYGYRLPALPSSQADGVTRVVCLGGRSLMMTYGLPDAEAIHQRMTAHSPNPMAVYNTGWAGDSLWRAWHYFNRTLAQDEDFDVAIIALVNPYLPPFAGRTDFALSYDGRPAEAIFPFMDGVMLWRGPLFYAHPRLSHAGYTTFALFRHADNAWGHWRQLRDPRPAATGYLDGSPEEFVGFARFLEHIRDELAARGTRSIVVMLPRANDPADRFAALAAALPDDLPVVDLHAEFHGTHDAHDFLAEGHYRAELADRIAERLSQLVNSP